MANFIPGRIYTGGEGEYYNLEDYQRLQQNVEAVTALLQVWRSTFTPIYVIIPQLITDIPTVETINRVEDVLEELALAASIPSITFTKTLWIGNQSGPNFEDFNRWERLLDNLHTSIPAILEAIPTLEITLGGVQYG